ncbi:HNH endonuclease signature motif containing protein [Azoarcus sp. KH32C]|uniref:HNH endonuclease n=1 Tax=Azoarcus sp. KH32C TaxID=748247 RepID=UPI00155A8C27|nr:HNH endonuclease signature motif containing protein [Azoarcus sp. KH32C]
MSKKETFGKFCEQLDCPLTNLRWSWSAISPRRTRAVFTVWADLLVDGRYMFWPNGTERPWMKKNGGRELWRNITTARKENMEALGVLCYPKKSGVDNRARSRFEREVVLVLEFVDEPDGLVAYVRGEAATAAARLGPVAQDIQPVPYAVDDVGAPGGNPAPDRVIGRTNGFRRDGTVRDYVIRRAQGKCEYCGVTAFRKASGEPYLEAHHIIGLAQTGPDMPHNVIALCANHHREAHYGDNADELERHFLEKVAQRESGRGKRGVA